MSINSILNKYKKEKENLIEILSEVQDNEGYISLYNQKEIANYLNISLTEVYSVVTFYSRFTLEPSGKYNISVCMGTACYVKGASELLNELESILKIKTGEITEDKKFKIVENRCVGACSLAPVVVVNDEVYGNCTTEKLNEIINSLKGELNE